VIGLLYGMGRLVGQGKRGALRHRGEQGGGLAFIHEQFSRKSGEEEPKPMAQSQTHTTARFNGVKIFSATMAQERENLGEKVTLWIREHPQCQVVDTIGDPVLGRGLPLPRHHRLLPEDRAAAPK